MSKSPNAIFELLGPDTKFSLSDAIIQVRPLVQIVVGDGRLWGVISLGDFLKVQEMAKRLSLTLEDCCHAMVLLRKQGLGLDDFERLCELSQEHNTAVNKLAQNSLVYA